MKINPPNSWGFMVFPWPLNTQGKPKANNVKAKEFIEQQWE